MALSSGALGGEMQAGGKETEVGKAPGYIYCFAQPQRFPVVVRFGQGQYIEVFIDQFGDLVKNAETFFKRGNTPFRERFPGGFNGCINILCCCCRGSARTAPVAGFTLSIKFPLSGLMKLPR